jgi:hypothetical protein
MHVQSGGVRAIAKVQKPHQAMINDILKLRIQLENDEHHHKRGTHTLAWQKCEQHVLSIRRCPSSRGK